LRPAHLLRFVHPSIHKDIGRPFGSAMPTHDPARCRLAQFTNRSRCPIR
jgi:hypothetical protein